MKLTNGSITISFDKRETVIKVHDGDANITFACLTLTPEQLAQALSGISFTDCEVEVFDLEKIGTRFENKIFEFEILDNDWQTREASALEQVEKVCPEGWESQLYFRSQDSFFERDGKHYAQTSIRRWLKK